MGHFETYEDDLFLRKLFFAVSERFHEELDDAKKRPPVWGAQNLGFCKSGILLFCATNRGQNLGFLGAVRFWIVFFIRIHGGMVYFYLLHLAIDE